jgi:hypothetical protein
MMTGRRAGDPFRNFRGQCPGKSKTAFVIRDEVTQREVHDQILTPHLHGGSHEDGLVVNAGLGLRIGGIHCRLAGYGFLVEVLCFLRRPRLRDGDA